MDGRTTWAVVTAALMVAEAVAVALLVLALTDWSASTSALLAAAVAGPGAAVVRWLRSGRLR